MTIKRGCIANKHNYTVYKEVKIPTGQWLMHQDYSISGNGSVIDCERPGLVEPVMRTVYLVVCSYCGDLKVKEDINL